MSRILHSVLRRHAEDDSGRICLVENVAIDSHPGMRNTHYPFWAIDFAISGRDHRRCLLRFILCAEGKTASESELRLQNLAPDEKTPRHAASPANLLEECLVGF